MQVVGGQLFGQASGATMSWFRFALLALGFRRFLTDVPLFEQPILHQLQSTRETVSNLTFFRRAHLASMFPGVPVEFYSG